MDDATRAELAALRLRAYGPDADIAADPAAVERLIELEARALEDQHVMVDSARALAPVAQDNAADEWPRGAIGHPPTDPDGLAQDPDGLARDDPRSPRAGVPASPDPGRAGGPRRRTIAVGIAAVIAVGIAVAVGTVVAPVVAPERGAAPTPTTVMPPEAYGFLRDPTARTLYEIPLDRALGPGSETPDEETPEMPSSGKVEWVANVGSFYGWELWIAGAAGALQPEHCILLTRGSRSEGRCSPSTLRSQSTLVIDLDYEDIAAGAQPLAMTRGQRIGFWWLEDDAITVLMGARLETR
ncbi:hypothetical protein [Microbacterium sp. P5_E9]